MSFIFRLKDKKNKTYLYSDFGLAQTTFTLNADMLTFEKRLEDGWWQLINTRDKTDHPHLSAMEQLRTAYAVEVAIETKTPQAQLAEAIAISVINRCAKETE